MNQTTRRIQYTLPDSTRAYFSRYNLKAAIHRAMVSHEPKISQQIFLEDMADATGNSFSAIKHWLAGHNAPSDLEKLRDIADYLKVELTDLLETEKENKAMTNTVTPIKAIDFSETKNVVRDIYIRMVDYIELFRTISALHFGEQKKFPELSEAFPDMYTAIMRAKLDLPTSIFNDLSSFASDFLQQMYSYRMFCTFISDDNGCFPERIDSVESFYEEYAAELDGSPWFDFLYLSVDQNSKDGLYFADAAKRQYLWDNDESNVWFLSGEIIVNAAYARLEEILKEFRAE